MVEDGGGAASTSTIRNFGADTGCAPRSPRAPVPANSLEQRQDQGKEGSLKKPWSNLPRNRTNSPISPRSMICLATSAAGVLMLLKATNVLTPAFLAAAAMRCASASFTAMGFSQ